MTDNTRTVLLKRTPLRDVHVKAGARMVPFGGWEMPVQYAGIIEEHRGVRRAVGLFDISHMGEFEVSGPDALAVVQRLCTNDASALAVGQVQYSVLCYPDGGIVDDLTLYRLADDRFMLTVNASNIEKDWQGVTGHGTRKVRWEKQSAEAGPRAGQGARAGAGGGGSGPAPRRPRRHPRALLPLRRGPGGHGADPDLAHRLHRRGRLRAVRAGGARRGSVAGAPRGRPRERDPTGRAGRPR